MNKQFNLVFVSVALFFTTFLANAQGTSLTGKVTQSNGEPIPGTTVVIKGTTHGTVTDINGDFILEGLSIGDIISFSFVGMSTKEAVYSGQINFSIVLEEATTGLDEVVVVAYGKQKKVSVTGSIAAVGTKTLLQSPQANISNALTGRMPGLLTVQRSGQPGADETTLRIRGIGTYAGDQDPLIMVDGIEVDNYNNIDPNEIESISILKDASATAVYGVRGANGVMLITTKRGQVGAPQISYSANFATSRFTEFRGFMNAYEYATNYNLAAKYDGYITGGYTQIISDEDIAHYKTGDNPLLYPDVDWFKLLFDKNAGQTQHNLNISGGTDKVKYFVSVGFFSQEGTLDNIDVIKEFDAQLRYKRYNIRSNFDFNVTKRLTVNVNIASQIDQRSGTNANVNSIFHAASTVNPIDSPDPRLTGGKIAILENPLSVNPPYWWLSTYGYMKSNINYLNSSLRFNYDLGFLTKGLSTHFLTSYNNYFSQLKEYSMGVVTYTLKRELGTDGEPIYIPQKDPSLPSVSESTGKNRKVYFEVGFNYSRTFGNHNVGGLLMYNQSKRYDPNLLYLIPNGYQGIVGRATYEYKERYFAEFNIGYNGTENFAPGKRFGFFPAYSVGWIPTEEPFFPKNDYLTFLKIRASYGVVGNDKVQGERFLYRPASYSYVSNLYYFGENGSNLQGYQGSLEGPLGNEDLTWERAKKVDIGADFAFFKDKLKFSFDYFEEHRNNILSSRNTVPEIVAAELPSYNLGKMRNSGYELEASYTGKLGDLNYWLKGTYGYAYNKIEYMDEVKNEYSYQDQTGKRYGQYFGLITDGFYNTWEEVNDPNRPVYSYANNRIQPGDMKYIDINGDGIIDSEDKVPIGYSNFPEKIFGISFGGSFNGFDFSCLFQGAGNVSISYHERYRNGFKGNVPDYLLESWSQERYDAGLPINFPRISQGPAAGITLNIEDSDFWIRDASYLRLKNVEIGYNIPDRILKRIGISNVRVYINGSNLLTWSDMFPGLDPESAATDIFNNSNYEPYPVTRTMNLGFNVKF